MLKRLLCALFLVTFSLIAVASQAAIDLELTKGLDRALPIAVLPFAGESATNSLSKIIKHDLENSGRFRLISVAGNEISPKKHGKIPYARWRHRGADDLVIGQVHVLTPGRYQVKFSLLHVPGADHKLVSKRYTVSSGDFRRLGHHIADQIYQQLTGNRGVFSTRISYILVTRRIGTATSYQLEVADADGYHPQALLTSKQPIMSPSWSPDGSKIAYVSFEKKRAQIYIVNVTTGARRLVTSFPGINGAPAWSPNGRSLAVVLSKSGHAKLYLVPLRGGKPRQLTYGRSIDTEPGWSPDGKSLIFTSDRGGAPQIYRLNLASKKISRVSYDGRYNARASYTPDGSNIVLLHQNGGMYTIAIQDVRTGQLVPLTNAGQSESPSIAPNGRMVLFATNYGGKGVLSMVSTDGKVRLRLPSREGDVQEPAWSPFLG